MKNITYKDCKKLYHYSKNNEIPFIILDTSNIDFYSNNFTIIYRGLVLKVECEEDYNTWSILSNPNKPYVKSYLTTTINIKDIPPDLFTPIGIIKGKFIDEINKVLKAYTKEILDKKAKEKQETEEILINNWNNFLRADNGLLNS